PSTRFLVFSLVASAFLASGASSSSSSLFFFFQAEDGIRDFHVTGVQTCALPICALGGEVAKAVYDDGAGGMILTVAVPVQRYKRSEERRVGKECRSRGAP